MRADFSDVVNNWILAIYRLAIWATGLKAQDYVHTGLQGKTIEQAGASNRRFFVYPFTGNDAQPPTVQFDRVSTGIEELDEIILKGRAGFAATGINLANPQLWR
ncbi:MAG TPA: hypothetical protein VNT76_18425, partial [Candidatus Binatus sp.]|nr:hypothetical protein [Candidatus Binatus sp.]